MTVIDIHTHMIPPGWLELLQQDGGGYELKKTRAGQTAVHLAGAPFVTLMPEMFDSALRLAAMDAAGVDMAVLSLTGPNMFWGSRETGVKAARIANAAYAEAQKQYGTDFPHNVGDMGRILALVRDLPGEQAGKAAGENAKRIFQI